MEDDNAMNPLKKCSNTSTIQSHKHHSLSSEAKTGESTTSNLKFNQWTWILLCHNKNPGVNHSKIWSNTRIQQKNHIPSNKTCYEKQYGAINKI